MKFELPGQLRGPECRKVIHEAVALRRLLEPWFLGLDSASAEKLSIVLRIDGSLGSFGPSGVENVECTHKHICCDLVIADHDWNSLNSASIRHVLCTYLLTTIEVCLARFEIEYDSNSLIALLSSTS